MYFEVGQEAVETVDSIQTAPKTPIKKKKKKDVLFIIGMLALPLIHFFVFWFLVNLNSIVMTFQKLDWGSGEYIFNGFGNFKMVFNRLSTDDILKKSIMNSIMYFPVTNFISLPLSILFSYYLFKKVPCASIFRVIFFLPSILPIVVLTMAFSFSFDSTYGPINAMLKLLGMQNIPTWFGKDHAQTMIYVYCIWAGLGFNIILLSGAIGRIPQDIMEYSKLEGVGMARELFGIVIPLVWPTITTTFLLGCTSVFTVMLQPLLLAPGNNYTQTISLIIYNGVLNDRDLPYITTLGLTLSVIGVPIIMLVRYLLGKVYADVEY